MSMPWDAPHRAYAAARPIHYVRQRGGVSESPHPGIGIPPPVIKDSEKSMLEGTIDAANLWAERTYHKLVYWSKVHEGDHFAAWEQPEIFTAEIGSTFGPLRFI
jgi:hypothetical protein